MHAGAQRESGKRDLGSSQRKPGKADNTALNTGFVDSELSTEDSELDVDAEESVKAEASYSEKIAQLIDKRGYELDEESFEVFKQLTFQAQLAFKFYESS